MKICMLTDAWFPIWGGGQEHIWETSKLLVKNRGCEIDIIIPNLTDKNGKKYPSVEKYLGGKLRLFRLGPPFVFPNLFGRLIFILHSTFYILHSSHDLYHSHSFSTSLFLPLARLRGKKCGVTVHGKGVNLVGGGVLNRIGLPKLLMNLVLYVWPYNFRLSASKLPGYVQVGNGVDVSEFDREKSRPDPKHLTALCVARPDPVKGIAVLEEAIKTVEKSHPKIRLNLVTGRPRSAKDFKTADLYVLPSLSEGFPIVLLEAMAAGLPIVATDVGDCRQLVEQARCGYVVPPGRPSSLAAAITRLTKTGRKEREKLGKNGYDFAKSNYTWEKVAGKVVTVYQSSLSR